MKYNFGLKIIILSQLVLFSALFFVVPLEVKAGCCECRLPTYSSGGKKIKSCKSGANDEADCIVLCNTTTPEINAGFPHYRPNCDADSCPTGEKKTCCVRVNKNDSKINQCNDNLSKEDCEESKDFSTTIGNYYERDCIKVASCAQLGKEFNSDDNDLTDKQEQEGEIVFKPSVTIPGSIKIGKRNFTVKEGEGIKVDGFLLAKYLSILFKWLVSVVGIVAVLFIAFAGLQWISAAGNAEMINKAKKTMKDSLLGVLLAVASYAMLYNINPDLVKFKELQIEDVKGKDLVSEGSESTSSASCSSLTNTIAQCDGNLLKSVSTSNITHDGHVTLYLQKAAKSKFESWMKDFKSNTGVTPHVTSMFRTPEYQKCLYESLGSKLANPPCRSSHEQGRAVDIAVSKMSEEVYFKLKTLGNIYDFKPANPNKGSPESWHFTYLGSDMETDIRTVCPQADCSI